MCRSMHMNKKIHIELHTPPEALSGRILLRIAKLERQKRDMRLGFFGVVFMCSVGIFIFAIQVAGKEFAQSGFFEYFKLLFSDSGVVASSWKEFGLSLVETLPVIASISVLAAIAFMFYSIRQLAYTRRFVFSN